MDSAHYHNPYTNQTFFGFFAQLAVRIWGFITGENLTIATDEVQILVLVGVAISASLVGAFLVLRKMTMLANSLSHTILFGIVIAFLLTRNGSDYQHTGMLNIQILLWASIGTSFLTAFLTEFLTKSGRLQEDASTGLVFTTLFALGIILVTLLTRSAHIGTEAVMGNVDALHVDDLQIVYLVLLINLVLFVLFFKEYKITTFDSGLARTLGIGVVFFNYLLMAQVSATVIGAFRAVGVLMVLAFITGPPLTARMLTNDLKKMLIVAALLGCLASLIGVALTRHFLSVWGIALSTSGVVVCVISALFAFTALVNVYFRKKSAKGYKHKVDLSLG